MPNVNLLNSPLSTVNGNVSEKQLCVESLRVALAALKVNNVHSHFEYEGPALERCAEPVWSSRKN